LPDILRDEGGPLTRDKSVAVTSRVRRRPQRFAVRGLVVDNRRIGVEDGQVVREAPTTLNDCATPIIQQCLAGVIVKTADTRDWGRGNVGQSWVAIEEGLMDGISFVREIRQAAQGRQATSA
jgi:hypothetical protein